MANPVDTGLRGSEDSDGNNSNQNRRSESNEATNNTGSDTNGTGAEADDRRPSRNITVSIQYSYFTPGRLGAVTFRNPADGSGPVPTTEPASVTTSGNISAATAAAAASASNGVEMGSSVPLSAAQGSNWTPPSVPNGAVVLSFRDVPDSTPQERLESIIAIAAELALRRLTNLSRPSRSIPKEVYDTLPIIKVSELPNGADQACSICYEQFVDEPEDENNDKKRTRDHTESDENEKRIKQPKKMNNEAVDEVSHENNATNNPEVETSTDTSAPPPARTLEAEEEQPTYLHSPVKLPCEHVFGRECLFKWSILENTCPLCRSVIAEAAPTQPAAQEDSSNNEAFERIREIIYNTNPNDLVPPTSNGASNPESTTDNSVPSGTDAPSVAAPPPPANATGPNASNNFTISNSNIFFLRPPNFNPASASTNNPPGAAVSTSASPVLGSTTANDAAPERAGRPAIIRPNAEGTPWIPIPITLIHLDTRDNAYHPSTPYSTEAATPTSATQPNAETSNLSTSSEQEQENAPRRTQSDRFRNILDHLFGLGGNNSRSAATDTTATNAEASTVVNTDSSSSGDNSQPPPLPPNAESRRSQFVNNILRIARSRNSTRNHQLPPYEPLSQDSLFNVGVASYRDRNGQVSTYNIDRSQDLSSLPAAATNSTATSSEQTENSEAYNNDNEPETNTNSHPMHQNNNDP